MKNYRDLWVERPRMADCINCEGNAKKHAVDPVPCQKCSWTGLEPIPWTELFSGVRPLAAWSRSLRES